MNVATGAKEKNESKKTGRHGGLRLVPRSDMPEAVKSRLKIGICENVFSSRRNQQDELPAENSDTAESCDSAPKKSGLPVVVTCAALALAVGYLVGRAGR